MRACEDGPGSLVDFVLSAACGINDVAKRQMMKFYFTEYETRVKFLTAKVKPLKLISKSSTCYTQNKLVQHEMSVKASEKEARLIKSSIEQRTREIREIIDKRNKQRRQRSLVDQRINKIEQLSQALQQQESLYVFVPKLWRE